MENREALTHWAIDRLVRVMRAHHRVIEKRIDRLDIHHSQHRTLMRLSKMGAADCQKDIAQALDVSPANVARTLKALSAAGLIEKREGTDGRCREIDILPAGQALIEASLKTFSEIDAEMFEGVSDEDVKHLTRTLMRVYDNLSNMESRKE